LVSSPLLRSWWWDRGLVGHTLDWLNFLGDWKVALCDLVSDFLVGTDQVAAQAAPRLKAVKGEVSLDVVAFSNLGLLDELENDWETDATREPETQASGVNGRETLKVGVLAKSVVGLAEGDAWAAAGDQARIDRIEATKESASPRVWASGWLGDNLWLVEGILESADPGVDIIGINGGGGVGSLLRSGHFDVL